MNASKSKPSTTQSPNKRPHKRARHSYGSKFRQKIQSLQPNEKLTPILRGSLHLDERFFPYGIQPKNIFEIKGPERSGKTFFLTYIIARALIVYPEKKVLFIDTRHKFSIKNFVSILCNFDKDITRAMGSTDHERKQNLNKPLPVLLEEHQKLLTYVDRVQVLQCYTPEDLMLIFGPPGESFLQKMLLQDPKVCLIAVDSIDNYSYSDSMQTSPWAQEWPNIMNMLKDSVNNTHCPVICTTLIPTDNHVYHTTRPPSQSKQASGRSGESSQRSTVGAHEAHLMNKDCPVTQNQSMSTSIKVSSQQKESGIGKCVSNFTIDYTVITNIIQLEPVSEAIKRKLVHTSVKKITHCVDAYLRSRHNAKTAGSGGNHRVRFSIFSDMLWVL